MTTISVSNEIDGAIVFEGDLHEDASSSSPSSAISLEVSGFVYFEQLLASIEPQPSAGPTSTTTTAANNDPLEGDNAPTHNNDRDASLTKSIENLRMDHNIAEGKLRRRKISSQLSRRVHKNLITGTGTRKTFTPSARAKKMKSKKAMFLPAVEAGAEDVAGRVPFLDN